MSASVTLTGFEELKAALRNLPAHLAQEASGIVTSHAEAAGEKIRSAYPIGPTRRHKSGGPFIPGGNLRKGVKVDKATVNGAGSSARVRSTAEHAWLYENGSQARHTAIGANRGAMPPHHVVAQVAVRERRAMQEDLIALVERNGLKVEGHG